MSTKTYSTIKARTQPAIEKLNREKIPNVAAIAREFGVSLRSLDILTKTAETEIKEKWTEFLKQMRIVVKDKNKKQRLRKLLFRDIERVINVSTNEWLSRHFSKSAATL